MDDKAEYPPSFPQIRRSAYLRADRIICGRGAERGSNKYHYISKIIKRYLFWNLAGPRGCDQSPSSPIIRVSPKTPGWAKGPGWFVRWLLIEFIPTAGAQAILPSIPTPERFLTAETCGRTCIGRRFWGAAIGAFRDAFLVHGRSSAVLQ